MNSKEITNLDIAGFVALIAIFVATLYPNSILGPLTLLIPLSWMLLTVFAFVYSYLILPAKNMWIWYGVPKGVTEARALWKPGTKTLQVGQEVFEIQPDAVKKSAVYLVCAMFMAMGIAFMAFPTTSFDLMGPFTILVGVVGVIANARSGKGQIVATSEGLKFILRGKATWVPWNDIVAIDEMTWQNTTTKYQVYTIKGRQTFDNRYSFCKRLQSLITLAIDKPTEW